LGALSPNPHRGYGLGRGEGGTMPLTPNHWERRKVPSMSQVAYILQYSAFTPKWPYVCSQMGTHGAI